MIEVVIQNGATDIQQAPISDVRLALSCRICH